MKKLLILIAATLLPIFAHAAECPVSPETENYLDKVVAEIQNAGGCLGAVGVAESCALGASGDGKIVAAVVPVCEAGFLTKLTTNERNSYENLLSKCFKKYENLSGSMYYSAALFCAMDVTRMHFQIFTPAATGEEGL